jgi:lipoprotein NlpD
VEDRGARHATVSGEPAHGAVAPAALPGADNAGKPGYYTVRQGDTLIRIALESGQNWRDIARWNNLDNPNVIEVGQVLRVLPPAAAETVAVRALPPASGASASMPSASAASAARGTASAPPQPAVPAEEEVGWAWPTGGGGVLAGFDEQKNKGLDIGGKAGDPVLAAADGRVVYAGAGLRGYGNLIILKHNNTYLTAYAHNQSLLVKEDQTVRKGQKIAEMGSSDTDRVKLHFEIRRQGKPVDPSRYLPAR